MQIQEEKSIFLKPKWELKQKGQPHPTRRWCHTAVNFMNDLFIFGGRFSDSAKAKQLVYKVNCETFQSQQINFSQSLSFRESHSCSLIKDSMYIMFGVEKEQVKKPTITIFSGERFFVLDDCLQFKITPNSLIWEKKPQKPQIDGRQSHLSTCLGGKYILIYGGVNKDQILLTDFYIYNIQDFSWRKVQKIKGNLEMKVGGSLTIINNQIYIFGGQINDQNQYSNQIYKIKIFNLEENENTQTQIQIFKLTINGVKPEPRTCHAATSYRDRYLIVLGGQAAPKPPSQLSTLLNNVWVFDVQKNQWEQLKIQNPNIFKPRSNFTATVYKDNLIVFGGLIAIKDYRSSDQMFVLFLNTGQNKLVCNICKTTFKQLSLPKKQSISKVGICSDSRFSTGISNILKISSGIKHPFECFGLILYSMQLLQLQTCRITLKQDLIFQLDNFNLTLDQWNHIRMIYQYNPLYIENDHRLSNALRSQIRRNHINFFAYNIKNVCLRLGNQFLLSWTNGQSLNIVLVNKFGIFQTNNPETQKSNAASHTSIVLQYIQEHNINLMSLFSHEFSVHVSTLKKTNDLNQIQFSQNFEDIQSQKQQNLKQYLQVYFTDGLNVELFLNQKLYRIGKLKKNNIINIQSFKSQFFFKVLSYKSEQFFAIYIYQHQRLLHKISTNYQVTYQFHLNKTIQPNITFTGIDPPEQLVQNIKQIIKQDQEIIKKRPHPEKGFQKCCIIQGKYQKKKNSTKNGIHSAKVERVNNEKQMQIEQQ